MAKVHILIPSLQNPELESDTLINVVYTKGDYPARITLVADYGTKQSLIEKLNGMFKVALQDPECRFIVTNANDIRHMTWGWLKLCIEKMEAEPDIGCLFPVQMIPRGPFWGQYFPDPITGASGETVYEEDPRWKTVNVDYDDFSHGMCITRREVFEKVGFLDTAFGTGSHQHSDMAYRMIADGWKIRMWGGAVIRHDYRLNDGIGTWNPKPEYDNYFKEKWGFMPGQYRADELYKLKPKPRFDGKIW